MAISTSTWVPIDRIGLDQAIDATSETQTYKIGTKVRCRDVSTNDRGEAVFSYHQGVASTAVGDMCVIKPGGGASIRTVARSHGKLGVAMSANVADQYGWYQVEGRAICNVAANFAADKTCYLTATDGVIDDSDSVVAGDQVFGARSAGAVDTNQALVDLSNPYAGDTDNS